MSNFSNSYRVLDGTGANGRVPEIIFSEQVIYSNGEGNRGLQLQRNCLGASLNRAISIAYEA